LFDCLTSQEQEQMLSLVEKLSTGLETMDRTGPFRQHHHGLRQNHRHCHEHHRSASMPFHVKGRNPDDGC